MLLAHIWQHHGILNCIVYCIYMYSHFAPCVESSGHTVDMYVQSGKHICLGAYANNVKCLYRSVCGHTVDGSKFREVYILI